MISSQHALAFVAVLLLSKHFAHGLLHTHGLLLSFALLVFFLCFHFCLTFSLQLPLSLCFLLLILLVVAQYIAESLVLPLLLLTNTIELHNLILHLPNAKFNLVALFLLVLQLRQHSLLRLPSLQQYLIEIAHLLLMSAGEIRHFGLQLLDFSTLDVLEAFVLNAELDLLLVVVELEDVLLVVLASACPREHLAVGSGLPLGDFGEHERLPPLLLRVVDRVYYVLRVHLPIKSQIQCTINHHLLLANPLATHTPPTPIRTEESRRGTSDSGMRKLEKSEVELSPGETAPVAFLPLLHPLQRIMRLPQTANRIILSPHTALALLTLRHLKVGQKMQRVHTGRLLRNELLLHPRDLRQQLEVVQLCAGLKAGRSRGGGAGGQRTRTQLGVGVAIQGDWGVLLEFGCGGVEGVALGGQFGGQRCVGSSTLELLDWDLAKLAIPCLHGQLPLLVVHQTLLPPQRHLNLLPHTALPLRIAFADLLARCIGRVRGLIETKAAPLQGNLLLLVENPPTGMVAVIHVGLLLKFYLPLPTPCTLAVPACMNQPTQGFELYQQRYEQE